MPSAEGPAARTAAAGCATDDEARAAESAVAALLQRMLPDHAHLFDLHLVAGALDAPHGHFRVSAAGRRVNVEGTSAVELASGAHWWLKHHACCSVSWDATGGPQIDAAAFAPERLGALEAGGRGETVRRAVPATFYQNVVTASYSFAFWDWDRWARGGGFCGVGGAACTGGAGRLAGVHEGGGGPEGKLPVRTRLAPQAATASPPHAARMALSTARRSTPCLLYTSRRG